MDYAKLDSTVTKIVDSLCNSDTSKEDLEDIKQDVMLSLLERYDDKLLEIASEHPEYIYVHTRSKVIDYFRASSRRLLITDYQDMLDELESEADVADEVFALQVMDAVRCLQPDEFTLLARYYGLTGDRPWTLRELADAEEVSIEAIHQRRNRILRKLNRELDEQA